jgi:hypothetical protein
MIFKGTKVKKHGMDSFDLRHGHTKKIIYSFDYREAHIKETKMRLNVCLCVAGQWSTEHIQKLMQQNFDVFIFKGWLSSNQLL